MELHPRGVIVRLKHCYAFFDEAAATFDVAEPEIIHRNPYKRTSDFEEERAERERVELVRDYWERLPLKNQAMFQLNGIIRYEDILVIDDKGDTWNELPHVFVDFIDGSPVRGTVAYLEQGDAQFGIEDMERIDVFPDTFPPPAFGTIYEEAALALPDTVAESYMNFRGDLKRLFDADGRYDHLQPTDVAVVRYGQKDDRFIQVTHRYEQSKLDMERDHPDWMRQVQQQIGREPSDDEIYKILEIRDCYRRQWEQK